MRSAQTFRKYKIKGIKFPTSSPIQAKGDKNRISCILKIEYTASGIAFRNGDETQEDNATSVQS